MKEFKNNKLYLLLSLMCLTIMRSSILNTKKILKINIYSFFVLFLAGCILFTTSCKKTEYQPQINGLHFGIDTFLFDTVFTEQGSSTRILKIFNQGSEDILIEKINFLKGEASPYSLTIDGQIGTSAQDIKILAKDSAYLFLRVYIDPTQENNPFIVGDDLIFTSKDQVKTLPILAFAQNAIYITDSVLTTQQWTAEKPYIIMHNALVAEDETLTIEPGTQIYMHADSRLYITGTLRAIGTLEEPIVFQGDRIDRKVFVGSHSEIPGEWGGLYFSSTSKNNIIDYAIIRNGGNTTNLGNQQVMAATIQVDQAMASESTPKLTLTNTKISTSLGYGVLAFNSNIYVDNCIITQCGADNFLASEGGKYLIYNSTMGTFSDRFIKPNQTSILTLSNYLKLSEHQYTSNPLEADVQNCIIYGSNQHSLNLSQISDHSFQVQIKNSLIKTQPEILELAQYSDLILNVDPQFEDWKEQNYEVKETSPAKGNGVSIGLSYDILGVFRSPPVTMGAIQ